MNSKNFASDKEIQVLLKKIVSALNSKKGKIDHKKLAESVSKITGMGPVNSRHLLKNLVQYLEDNRSKKGTVQENFRFRMKFRFQKYEDWPHELFAAAQAFRKKYRIYPNIMLANKETYMRIDMIANFRGRSSIGGSDGEKPEKTEYAVLGTFVADSFEIDFARSKKLVDRNFVLVYDSNPDWDGGETVETPKTEKKKKAA